MSVSVDYYDILGISKTATKEEIKTAYRTLSRKYHPDVNEAANASTMFMLLDEAYQNLFDDEKRRAYDNQGKTSTTSTEQTNTQNSQSYYSYQKPQYTTYQSAPAYEQTTQYKDYKAKRGIFLTCVFLLLKLVGLILIPILYFLTFVCTLLCQAAQAAGSIICLIGLIMCAFTIHDYGFVLSWDVWFPLPIAFFGFLIILLGQRLPEWLAMAIGLISAFVFDK